MRYMTRKRKLLSEVQEDTSEAEVANIVDGFFLLGNIIDGKEHNADAERNNQVIVNRVQKNARKQWNVGTGNNLGRPRRASCAACKYGRLKCEATCITAPFFPSDKMKDYESVVQIFTLAKVKEILGRLKSEDDRHQAAESLQWEAQCWVSDGSSGPYDDYKKLKAENTKLRTYNNELLEICRPMIPHLMESMPLSNVNQSVGVGNVNVLYGSGTGNGGEGYNATVNTGFRIAGGGGGGSQTLMNDSINCDCLLNSQNWSVNAHNYATPIKQPEQYRRQETDVRLNVQSPNFHPQYYGTRIQTASNDSGIGNGGEGYNATVNTGFRIAGGGVGVGNVNVLYASGIGNGGEGCNATVNTGFQIAGGGGGNQSYQTLMNNSINCDCVLNCQNWSVNEHNYATPIKQPKQYERQEADVCLNAQSPNFHPQYSGIGIQTASNGNDGSHTLMNNSVVGDGILLSNEIAFINAQTYKYATPIMQPQQHGSQEADEPQHLNMHVTATQSGQHPNSHPQ